MSEQKTSGWAVFEPKGPFKPWEFELHPLGDFDVEIKVVCCGMCHSDLHTVSGEWGTQNWPIVPGHEVVGYITKVGEKVKTLNVGQRVGVGPQALSCGSCRQCKKQNEAYCYDGVFTYGSSFDDGYVTKGGYADTHRVDEKFCFPIPDGMDSFAAAPLLCAGITVFSPLQQHKIGPGSRVGVIGIGGLGHLGVQYAAALGAEVTALSTSSNKEQEAKTFGAKHFVNYKEDKAKKIKNQFDFLLNTVSAATDWNMWADMLDVGGVLCDVGAPEHGFKINLKPSTVFFKRLNITGSLIGSPHEFVPMLEFSHKHKCLPLIERVDISKVNETAERVTKNQVRYRAVLEVNPNYKP